MFRYNYIGDLLTRLISVVDMPLQVELQPGIHCGPFHCPYCYGRGQKLNEGLLSIAEYSNLLSELEGRTQFLAVGGIVSDPLTYPAFTDLLRLVIEKKFKFGISTKGYFLTEEIVDILSRGLNEDCFINCSIDAPNSDIYSSLRGVKNRGDAFEHTRRNIERLKEACDRRKSKLRIKASYLLFRKNAKLEYYDTFVDIFSKIVSEIRFSIPQFPNCAEPVGYLDTAEIKSVLQDLQKYKAHKNIVVLRFDRTEHDKSFEKCWAQWFGVTVDKAGYVYPCPQVTSKYYPQLIIGNIREQGIWDIWKSKERRRLFEADVDKDMKCRVCDRKDEAINVELNKLLNPDLFI